MHFDDAPAPLHHSETRWSSGVLGEMLHCAERRIALGKINGDIIRGNDYLFNSDATGLCCTFFYLFWEFLLLSFSSEFGIIHDTL